MCKKPSSERQALNVREKRNLMKCFLVDKLVRKGQLKYPLTIITLLIAFPILWLSSQTHAQAQVRSSSSNLQTAAPASTVSPASTTFFETQSLQQEVLELRGLVEEQAHQLKRLKQQRLDDYVDLDKRISELAQRLPESSSEPVAQPTSTPKPNTAVAPSVASIPSATSASSSVTNAAQHSDQLYDDGIELLLNKQDYTGAKQKFSEYAQRFPRGKYIPNTYYWQAQILFVEGNKTEAANNFVALIDQYPNHIKVPDAQFKLARIYFEQGKKAEAKTLLDEVASSESDTARLAKSFINKNY